jgi:hypothetical protein
LFIIVDVDTDPPIFEVIVFTDDDKVFGTSRFVIVAFVITAFVFERFASVRFVPVALSKIRDDIYADKASKNSVNKLVVVALAEIKFVSEAFVEKRFVVVAFVKFESVPVRVMIVPDVAVIELNIGLSENIYVTFPDVSVATVRFEFVEEAKKFSKFETDVVAITPFIVVVIIPFNAETLFEFIIFVEVETPFTIEVRVFTVEDRSF